MREAACWENANKSLPAKMAASRLDSDHTLPCLAVSGRSLTGVDLQLAHRFKLNGKEELPELLERALTEKGWEEHDPRQQGVDGWNLIWQNRRFSISQHLACKPWQRVNHFPGSLEITHKDGLVRAMRRLQSKDPSASRRMSNFIPESLVLPREYLKLVDLVERRRHAARQPGDDVWIYKPANQSRGRGIYLFREAGRWKGSGVAVAQRYIRPLLIGGFKFDLRLYVAVLSFKPLVAYIYQDFLVRFATEKYSLDDLTNVYAHLTNTSINTQGPGYLETKGKIGTGCKWNMQQLCIHFHQDGIDDRLLWQQITNIVILTLLCQDRCDKVPNPNCVELLGFDIMIDESFRPWLLEVNDSPSLGNDCEVDEHVKIPMLADLLDLMNLKESDQIPQCQPRMQRQPVRQRPVTTGIPSYARPITRSQRDLRHTATKPSVPRTPLQPRSRLNSLQHTPSRRPSVVMAAASRPSTGYTPRSSRTDQVPSRLAPPTPEPPELFVGNYVLIFPFNRATRRDETISHVIEELQRREEELRASFAGPLFDWCSKPRSYPFAMHQEAEWPIFWPGMQHPIPTA